MSSSTKKSAQAYTYTPIVIRRPPPKIADLALPDSLQIAAAAPGLPPAATRFLGVWIGFWGEALPHVLAVERMEGDGTAHVLYAVRSPETANVRRLTGVVQDSRLVLDSSHADISYQFDRKDRLLGRYLAKNGSLAVGVFEPIEIKDLFELDRLVPHPPLGEIVRIPHCSVMSPDGSRPVTLEGTLYRFDDVQTAPLAIINHGSTGGQIIDPRKTFRHEAEALWLLERGFTVLVPMRRGRGTSEGLFGEEQGFADPGSGLHEALEDLRSALVYGRSLSFVEAGPVLLVGVSRGGFLSIVFASRHPNDVAAVVSFAGGWMGRSNNVEFNTQILGQAGRSALVPQLWLYGQHDSHYSEDHIRLNHAAFVRDGGQADLTILTASGDGHFISKFPSLWRPHADAYLDSRFDDLRVTAIAV